MLNNNGGGIFSFLPIAQFPGVFEKYFATPHHLQFEFAAQMFGLHYANPKSPDQLVGEYNMAFVRKKSTIIEVMTDRKENYQLHQELQKAVQQAIEKHANGS